MDGIATVTTLKSKAARNTAHSITASAYQRREFMGRGGARRMPAAREQTTALRAKSLSASAQFCSTFRTRRRGRCPKSTGPLVLEHTAPPRLAGNAANG